MFIIVAFIYLSYGVLANESDNCTCDVLHMSGGSFGNQNFTKQNNTRNGKPYYFSTKTNMISWNNQTNQWSYEKYNLALREFWTENNYGEKGEIFSFAKKCEKTTWKGKINDTSTWIHSQCLIDDSSCSFTKELTSKLDGKQVQLQAWNPCKFPFIYKDVT